MLTSFPFTVGALECAAVSAGTGRFRIQAFFADIPAETLTPVLKRYGIRTEKVDTPFNCLVVRHPDSLIVVDTGTKPGKLTDNLRQMGIAAEDVGLVVLSHAHPDHIYGAVDKDGEPTFPKARYVVARPDFQAARARLGNVTLQMIEPGDELLDGVRSLPAPGHTAGQIAVQVRSLGETLLYTSDVIAHPIHVEQPTWNIVSDADRPQALATRDILLGQAADEGWWLFVYHFPFPGLCRIERDGSRWRIVEQRTTGGRRPR